MVICASVRNEARYMLEWLAYHRAIGIGRFVIYDNESTDETTELLTRLEKTGWLTRIPWLTPDSKSPQLLAYWDFIIRHSAQHSYSAFLDLDEFISLPSGHYNIESYFNQHGLSDDSVSAVAVNQRVFGSSGHQRLENRFVIERFTKAASEDYAENLWFKSFFRPARVAAVPIPHAVQLLEGRYVNAHGRDLVAAEITSGQTTEVCNGVRVNHYILKSLEEFRMKQARGGGAGATMNIRAARYNDDFFYGRETFLNKLNWAFPDVVLANAKREYDDITRFDQQ